MKRRFSAIILSAALMLSGISSSAIAADTQNDERFSDISTHWAKASIQELLKKNAIPFDEDKYLPNNAIKKSEFAVMLHNALDIQIEYFVKPEIKDYFDDINEDAPYASAVIDLVSANIFEGSGNFNPESSLSREEMIHFIMLAYKYEMADDYAAIKIGPATFTDADKIDLDFSGDIARAQHDQLIVGSGNNMFQPKKATTRAEAAEVVNRLSELLAKQNRQVLVCPNAVISDNSIEMNITITNNTAKDIYIEHSSGQMFDFMLLDANEQTLYTWSSDKSFIAVMTSTVIKAGETLVLSDTLSGDSYKEIKDKIVSLKAFIAGDAEFINSQGYEISLK